MKTRYETPTIDVLKLYKEDIVVTSYNGPVLGTEDMYTGTAGSGKFVDLFG